MKGSQIVVKTLEKLNIDTVFGYPGGQVIDIYDALADSSLHHVLTAHEQGAVHGADGYARASGKIGVVIATSGPGATNIVTGLAVAYADSTPMLAITGNVPLSLLGTDSFQEVDTTGITLAVTKHNFIVKDIKDLSETLVRAYEIATSGRCGPVLVDIPKNIQIGECEFEFRPPVKKEYGQYVIKDALKLIKSSKRPLIYCGGGVVASGASDALAELSDLIDAPVVTSMMGLSAFPYDDPKSLGMVGMHGQYSASKAEHEADLIIAVGVRFSERTTGSKSFFAENTKILHIDIDPAEINKNIEAYTGIEGDVREVLSQINSKLTKKARPAWMRRILELKEKKLSNSFPKEIINAVHNQASDDTVIATDVGQHQMWVAQYYGFKKPRTFISSGGMGAMGFGMGAAIGACLATGKRHTVLFTGDGSFLMNLNELATAVAEDLPIIVVLFNNHALGMVRQWQTLFYQKRYSQTTLSGKTDYLKVAEGFSAKGCRVENRSELKSAVREAFSQNGPFVIDCTIDIDEAVFPMIPPGGTVENILERD